MRELEYVLFLAERSIEDAKNYAYIQECIVLAEGTNVVPRLNAINEGVVDKAKIAWKKIQEWVKNAWAKFSEKFNKLAMNDAEYLKKYRDVIFNKKPVDATYTMLNYPEAIVRCTKVKVPKLNYAQMKDKLEPNNPGSFLKTIITEYDGKGEPADYIKTYFKGGTDEPESIHVSKLKFADMYDFCVDYKKIHTVIENDKKTLEASYDEAIRAINALERTTEVPPATGAAAPTATGESAINRFFAQAEAFSRVYGGYITEADAQGSREVTDKGQSQQTDRTTTGAANQKAAANMSSTTQDDKNDNRTPEQRKADTQSAVKTDDQGKVKQADADDAIEKINVYNTITTNIMSAKLSTVEGAQKTYMKILRTHIKDHVGNKDSESGNNSSRTDYRSPYEKSSEEQKAKINEWSQKNINMSVEDLLGKLEKGEAISADVIGKIKDNAQTFIGYLGQGKYDAIITTASVQ